MRGIFRGGKAHSSLWKQATKLFGFEDITKERSPIKSCFTCTTVTDSMQLPNFAVEIGAVPTLLAAAAHDPFSFFVFALINVQEQENLKLK